MREPVPETVCIVGASGRFGSRSLRTFEKFFSNVVAVVAPGDMDNLPNHNPSLKICEGDIRSEKFANFLCSSCDHLIFTLPPTHELVDAAASISRVSNNSRLKTIFHISQLNSHKNDVDPLGRVHAECSYILSTTNTSLTTLRCNIFSEQLVELISDSVSVFGEIWLPVGEGKIAPIACSDIAQLICLIILENKLNSNQMIDVSGPTSLNLTEVATLVSRYVGFQVSYVEKSLELWSLLINFSDYNALVGSHLSIASHQIKVGRYDVTGISGVSITFEQTPLESVIQAEKLALSNGKEYIGIYP